MAFFGAPINDMTGKISDNKGGGAPATPGTPVAASPTYSPIQSASTLAIGEDGGAIDATGGSSSNAPAEVKGGGAPLTGEPTVFTTAFGEEGTAPGAPPVGPFAGDTPVGNVDNTNVPVPPVANPIDPNIQIDLGPPETGMTRAIGEDGTGPGLADLIVPSDEQFPVTTAAIGEDGNGPSLTDLIGKEPFNEVTTMAVGEEGDGPPFPGGEILQPPIVQPPGGTFATTQAVGEEEGDLRPPGGGMLTTQAMFEDGMPTPPAPPVANPYQPQPRPPAGGAKGGGMQPQPQPFQPQPFQPYQPQPFMPQPPMYGGGFGSPYGGSFGSPYGSPYGGGFGGGYGMQRPQPFGGSFYGNPYMPPPPPTPYGGGKGGGFGQQQMPQPPMNPVQGGTQPPAYNQQPMGKGGGAQPQQPPQGVSSGSLGTATQAYAEDDFIAPPKDPNAPSPLSNPGGLFGMLGAGSLLGGQQNTGGSSNNASPFGGSSGGGSRTAMF